MSICAECQYAYVEVIVSGTKQNKCVDTCPSEQKYADIGVNGKYVCRSKCSSGAFVYNDSFNAKPSKFVCLPSNQGTDCEKFYISDEMKRCVNCTGKYFKADSA